MPSSNMAYTSLRKLHKYGVWRTWNANIRSCGCFVVVFYVVVWSFFPLKWTSIINIGHVVCQIYSNLDLCDVFMRLHMLNKCHLQMSQSGWSKLRDILDVTTIRKCCGTYDENNSCILHSWMPLLHKSRIECTSPSRSKVQ